jgi:Kef-type K+ transport system membrane component KefB
MESSWGIAALWMGLALVASLLAIRFRMSIALVEILVGIAAGNIALLLDHYQVFRDRGMRWELKANEWIKFLAGFGSILLTFGTISALFGLNNGHISKEQYSILVTVVIASAIVPTLIAQGFFRPSIEPPVVAEIEGAVADGEAGSNSAARPTAMPLLAKEP